MVGIFQEYQEGLQSPENGGECLRSAGRFSSILLVKKHLKGLKGTAEPGEWTDAYETGATRQGFGYLDHGTHLGNLFYWRLMGSISKRRGSASSWQPVKMMKKVLNLKAWEIIKKNPPMRLWSYWHHEDVEGWKNTGSSGRTVRKYGQIINFLVNEQLESREIHLKTDGEPTEGLWIKEREGTGNIVQGVCEKLWQSSEVPTYWKRGNITRTALSVVWTVEVNWMLSKFTEDTKLCADVNSWREGVLSEGLGCRGGVVWASWSSTRSSAKFFTWVMAIPITNQAGWRMNLEQPWMEALGALVDKKLNVSHQCTLAENLESQLYSGLHEKEHSQQVKGGDSVLLNYSCDIPPVVLLPAVGSPAQEINGLLGVSPEDGCEDD